MVRFLATPENRSALSAIQDLLLALTAGSDEPMPNAFLHGPSGSGKTRLVQMLAEELASADVQVFLLSANDFAEDDDRSQAQQADLCIVEDLQHLPARYVETLIQMIDTRGRFGLPMIFTALHGPVELQPRGIPMSRRLANRLAGGLVVAVDPMQAPSRRRLLQALADEVRLTVSADILDWLAEHLSGGGRQMEGAIRQLRTLQRLQARPLCLDEIRGHFHSQTPMVVRITEHVSGHFQVPPSHVVSARRSRDVLLPRQLSMYLARQLTGLSLQKIGKFFGGRDHKTVQHACKKVEAALRADVALSSAVRRMRAGLA